MNGRHKRTAAAGLVCAVTCCFLLSLAYVASPSSSTETARPAELAAGKPPSPLQPIAAYAAITEHELFAPDRKPYVAPPPPEAPVVSAPPPVLGAVILLAVIMSPTRDEAVIRSLDGSTTTVAEGEDFRGWTLDRVLPDRVTFHLGAASSELLFPVNPANPTGPETQTATLPKAAVTSRNPPSLSSDAAHHQ